MANAPRYAHRTSDKKAAGAFLGSSRSLRIITAMALTQTLQLIDRSGVSHRQRMHDRLFRHTVYPIVSSAVESACNVVVQQPMTQLACAGSAHWLAAVAMSFNFLTSCSTNCVTNADTASSLSPFWIANRLMSGMARWTLGMGHIFFSPWYSQKDQK